MAENDWWVVFRLVTPENIDKLAVKMGWQDANEMANDLCFPRSYWYGKWAEFDDPIEGDLPENAIKCTIFPVFFMINNRVYEEKAEGAAVLTDAKAFIHTTEYEKCFL